VLTNCLYLSLVFIVQFSIIIIVDTLYSLLNCTLLYKNIKSVKKLIEINELTLYNFINIVIKSKKNVVFRYNNLKYIFDTCITCLIQGFIVICLISIKNYAKLRWRLLRSKTK
jgi:hypothetical protein